MRASQILSEFVWSGLKRPRHPGRCIVELPRFSRSTSVFGSVPMHCLHVRDQPVARLLVAQFLQHHSPFLVQCPPYRSASPNARTCRRNGISNEQVPDLLHRTRAPAARAR